MDINTSDLYQKFGVNPSSQSSQEIFQKLSAFWQHFALHRRKCDKTGKNIISVFSEHCPYPVWHHQEWMKDTQPPSAHFDFDKPFFEQLWELFQQCPIPHNVGAGNENCEYTDDWWYGKNCYLCHSGLNCEDLHYCFRTVRLKDCQFCVFSFDSELCTDLTNCNDCFNVHYALNRKNCQDSRFLFDCRNCSDCLFCWNLRHKKHCILNKQLTPTEYASELAKYDFSSRTQYQKAKQQFNEILRQQAWWRCNHLEQCENSTGDILDKCKNCQNCYFLEESEDCLNTIRGFGLKDTINTVSCLKSELVYYSSMAQDQCYDVRCCYNIIQSKFLEYCAHCYNCQNCFACCGLVNKKYCILNQEYSPEEYQEKVQQIKTKLQSDGVYGQFFPNHFAACPYEESLAGFHWPLTADEQKEQGYRLQEYVERKNENYSSPSEIPDSSKSTSSDIHHHTFWDEQAKRPFQITDFDLKFCQKTKTPLPNSYYIQRLKENFRYIFFTGELRNTQCAATGQTVSTSLPPELDSRILSVEAYLAKIG